MIVVSDRRNITSEGNENLIEVVRMVDDNVLR